MRNPQQTKQREIRIVRGDISPNDIREGGLLIAVIKGTPYLVVKCDGRVHYTKFLTRPE